MKKPSTITAEAGVGKWQQDRVQAEGGLCKSALALPFAACLAICLCLELSGAFFLSMLDGFAKRVDAGLAGIFAERKLVSVYRSIMLGDTSSLANDISAAGQHLLGSWQAGVRERQ